MAVVWIRISISYVHLKHSTTCLRLCLSGTVCTRTVCYHHCWKYFILKRNGFHLPRIMKVKNGKSKPSKMDNTKSEAKEVNFYLG